MTVNYEVIYIKRSAWHTLSTQKMLAIDVVVLVVL